jgi:hypothetical protein
MSLYGVGKLREAARWAKPFRPRNLLRANQFPVFSITACNELDDGYKSEHATNNQTIMIMIPMLAVVPMFAAIGYSLVYLLAGGGLGGAVLIFIVAKMLGK